MERQPYPPPGSCVAKNSQRRASVETVQGGVPPYGVKEPLVVNGKWWCWISASSSDVKMPLGGAHTVPLPVGFICLVS